MPGIEWTLVSVGHLSLNRYWGDTERRRSTLCTSTLITRGEERLLVDPSVPPEEAPRQLDEAAGLRPDSVTAVFLTHFHADHRFGLEAFPDVPWYMAEAEVRHWLDQVPDSAGERRLLERIRPAPAELMPGVCLLPLPGHTPGLNGLLLDWQGVPVVVAGDACMTQEYFRERAGFHNSWSHDLASDSLRILAEVAEVVVPGHGNYFLVHPERLVPARRVAGGVGA